MTMILHVLYCFKNFFLYTFFEVQLIYNVSSAQQGNSVIHIYMLFLKLFSIIGYYKILTRVPFAIQ